MHASSKRHQHSTETVIAAHIAGRLNQARRDAGRLSLAAKNLSVIANRIGTEAAGLRTLSEFYDEFAQRSIRLSEHINKLSADISRTAVKGWRQHQLESCLQYALQQHDGPAEHCRLIETSLAHSQSMSRHIREQSFDYRRHLQQALDDLSRYMQTMKVIAVNSRIEASQLHSYQAQLRDLSSSIDQNTNGIMAHLDFCQRELKELSSHD